MMLSTMSSVGSARFSGLFDQFRSQAKTAQAEGNQSTPGNNSTESDEFVPGSPQTAPSVEGEKPRGGIVGFFKKVIKFGAMIYGAYLAVKTVWNKITSLFSSKNTQEA